MMQADGRVDGKGAGNATKATAVRVLQGETVFPPPLWMMRQAGRYLPEYRALRKEAGSFLDLCYNPDFAVEVTLQPIRRFGFDVAILFSDILVVPDALDRDLRFVEGEGPRLEPIDAAAIRALPDLVARKGGLGSHLAPVIETVRRLRGELPAETALFGFCGAPWTVATYMLAGRGTPDQAPARMFAHTEPAAFDALLELLTDVWADYLIDQVDAGAQVLVVSTNNASFGRSAASAQHLAFSQVRAVETGRWVVHAGISGISALVDPTGAASQQTGLFEQAIVRGDVPLVDEATPALVWADRAEWFAVLVTVAAALLVAVGSRRRDVSMSVRPGPR